MRHLFAAEREVAKFRMFPGTRAPASTTVAVIGAGTMGSGIAMCVRHAGVPRDAHRVTEAALSGGWTTSVPMGAWWSVGRIRPRSAMPRLAQIVRSLELEEARTADLIVECAFEDMGVKQDLFVHTRQACKARRGSRHQYLGLDVTRLPARAACVGLRRHAFLQPGQHP